MKIILSRKGFDSSATSGASASPIFPDGSIVSLPIPDCASRQQYCDLRSPIAEYENLGEIVDRMPTDVSGSDGVHLDPDLDANSIDRRPEWRGLFGQSEAAQSHLSNSGVCVGDLFITFGWFREIEGRRGNFQWRRAAPDLHMIFGWIQVGEVLNLGSRPVGLPDWAQYHPHNVKDVYPQNNTLYVAMETLSLPGVAISGRPGAGVFRQYEALRQLTAPNATGRSKWRLPAWFDPSRAGAKTALTYHAKPSRWRTFDSHVELDSVGRGQEFVFDADVYPEALEWFASMVR